MGYPVPMNRSILASLGLAACCAGALAQPVKVPVESGEQGTVYVSPNVSSTETSARTNGATLGVRRPDGSATYGGVDTSGVRPNYSLGGSTGGNTSFSAGAHSDGKNNAGIKAGVKIRY